MTERKLARCVIVDELYPIEGADRIELAIVGGWQVVVQKGLYTMGCKAVYFEVDSLLPISEPWFGFLSSSKNVEVGGVQYARIKTIKLRKQLSQGLLIPLEEFGFKSVNIHPDDDFTDFLSVIKYEKPEEKSSNSGGVNVKTGISSLGFPKFIPKTDQTRVQNISVIYNKAVEAEELFEKSYKLDGSSLTMYNKDGYVGVCSRNVGMRLFSEEKSFWTTLSDFWGQVKQRGFRRAKWERFIPKDDNHFTQMAEELNIAEKLTEYGGNIAVQGELVGPGIQKNFEGREKNEFYCYNVFDIDSQTYMLPVEAMRICIVLDIPYVPLASSVVRLPPTLQACIDDADGPSGLGGKYREGFVYKSLTRDFSFKVISNKYLLKEE
jgi:RNA ligase (TIGR02306 family)